MLRLLRLAIPVVVISTVSYVLMLLWTSLAWAVTPITIVASPEFCNVGGVTCVSNFDCCSGTCSGLTHKCVTATNSITLKTPANAITGDLLVSQVVYNGCGGDNPIIPVGWSNPAVDSRGAGSCGGASTIASKIYTLCVPGGGPATSYAWVWGNNTGSTGGMLAFRGTNCTVEAAHGTSYGNASSGDVGDELVTPGLVSIGYGNMLVLFYGQYIPGGATLTLSPDPDGTGWNRDNTSHAVLGIASQWHLMADAGLSPSYAATSSGHFGVGPIGDISGGTSQALLICPEEGCEVPAPTVTPTITVTETPTTGSSPTPTETGTSTPTATKTVQHCKTFTPTPTPSPGGVSEQHSMPWFFE